MVQAKPTTPVWNTADPFYTNAICALPFMDGIGVVAADLSGNGRDGSLVAGATWFNDPTLGVVVQLDGTSGYVALSALLNAAILATPFTGGCTISMWLRLRLETPTVSTKTGFMDLGTLNATGTASKWPAGGSFGGETNGTGYLNILRTTTRINVGALGAITKTAWHHVVITQQAGGNWKLYINGAIFFTATADNPTPATLAPTLGRSTETGGGGPFFLDGWLGDFRVYNREFLAPEVLSLFNSPWNLYTVTAPNTQARVVDEMVDARPTKEYSARSLHEMVDALPFRSDDTLRMLGVLADAVPYHDPATSPLPPNDPGLLPLDMADAFNPRCKPLDAGPPTLNADPVNVGTIFAMPFTSAAGLEPDRSGNGNNGTYTGTAARDTSLSSFYFRNRVKAPGLLLSSGAGSNYVRVTDAAVLKPASFVSVAAWVRPRGFPTTTAPVVTKLASTDSYGLFITTAGVFQFRVADVIDGTATVAGGSFTNAQQGAPFHLVGTYDGATVSLYVNGALVASVGNSGAIQYSGALDLFIGGTNTGQGNANASIDAVQIWSRAITAAEVRQLYSANYPGVAPAGVPVLNAGSGAFGNYSTGALADSMFLMADAVPYKWEASSRMVGVLADALPTPAVAARSLMLMVDATPALQNAAGLGVGSITPNFGTFNGGTPVTIRGQYFRNVTAVYVGGVLCTSIVVVNETLITAVTGAHIAGLVDVRVDSSTFGTVIAPNLYQYVGGLVAGFNALLRGKQFAPTMWNQDPPGGFYSGETAPLAVDTTLSFTLADRPTVPQAVEVFVRRTGETGYGRMRYLIDYDVVISTRKIIWKGATAAFAIVPADEIVVAYPGQG